MESIRRFPDQKTLAGLMGEAGLARASFTNLTGGVVALHQGTGDLGPDGGRVGIFPPPDRRNAGR